jgi:predicted transcriptional regulator
MQLNPKQIEDALISEIRLTSVQAKIFLEIVLNGKMTSKQIGEKLGITDTMANENLQQLIQFGGLIDYTETEFEALHPRFASVNMYRKMCERENLEFKKNNLVDNIGIVLENVYDDVRTKYNKRK